MKVLRTCTLLFLGGLSATTFAEQGNVFYNCQNGQEVQVHYHFNSAGLPTKAETILNGKKRTLAYDMARSDDVDTIFSDSSGYNLATSYMDKDNYRQAAVLITAPNGNILYKSCLPDAGKKKGETRKKNTPQSQKEVAYMCQNNRRLKVRYRFNEQGIPVSATAKLRGKNRTLNYDMHSSNDVETAFSASGWRLGTDYMDADNYATLPVIITAPDNEILYKNCMPQ